jgi:hypothetical protein
MSQTPTDKPDVSVIIVSYRNGDELHACLHSLSLSLSDMQSEVVIVANDEIGSTIGYPIVDPILKIIRTEKNIGFGAAANIGARAANGDTLFFLNPDACLITPSIKESVSRLEKSVCAVGFGLLEKGLRPQPWSAGRDTNLLDILLNNLSLPRSRRVWKSSRARHADWVSGAAFMVKRDMFLSLGGFDEEYFLYFEDMDLCRRLRARGNILFAPNVSVVHAGGKSFQNARQQKKYYYASQLTYFRKHRGNWEYALLRILHTLMNL